MKNYYCILGLTKEADKKRIKRAYRDKVKQLHPDKTGEPEDRQQFLDATEAYETLADTEKRAEYDRKLNDPDDQDIHLSVSRTGKTMYSRRSPGRKPLRTGRFPQWGSGPRRKSAERGLELVLRPEEARRGGRFRIIMPLSRPCPYCAERGLASRMFCPACGGENAVRTDIHLLLDVPAGISDGASFCHTVKTEGGYEIHIHVTVRIE
jgi:molecular chaperone DnaJ